MPKQRDRPCYWQYVSHLMLWANISLRVSSVSLEDHVKGLLQVHWRSSVALVLTHPLIKNVDRSSSDRAVNLIGDLSSRCLSLPPLNDLHDLRDDGQESVENADDLGDHCLTLAENRPATTSTTL
jgi:hypothetical protein